MATGGTFEVVYRSLNAWDTQLMHQALKTEGIQSFMDNANLVNIHWLYSNVTGGVSLLVYSEDADEARKILLPLERKRLEQGAVPCPHCGSADTAPLEYRGLLVVLSYLIMGIPLFFHKKHRCNTCKASWRE